ncbi:MAG TPA: RluA family pseudouridine synthase [Albitalea sp.]|nr:RluA family pseudouridine synthase [Albitalea sp.]
MHIVHADAALIAVDKPEGMLAVPGRGEAKQDCAAARVQARFGDALVVHRLDMATSGLMLLARGIAVQRALGAAFARREIHKRYVAVVEGLVAEDAGEIDLPLAADWPNRPRQKIDPSHGKASLTRYRVLARDLAGNTTRLELEPVTGRTHQLRVHLLGIGHPIVGDRLYAAPVHARLLLHASCIELVHPALGHALSLSSEPPF